VDTRDAYAAALREIRPDVVLCDHSVGQFNAIGAFRMLQSTRPATPFIVVTGTPDDERAVTALRAGVEDVVFKTSLDRLAASIESAIAIRRRLRTLTPRQFQVLRLVAEGHTTPEIALRLRIGPKTVETHRSELMRRLAIHDALALARFALRMGVIPGSQ
jgi:DNA-binding NarL/FixJ family response regulator